MSAMRPITIRRGSFVCTIYDVDNLMELPPANLRKLWKIMFSASWENKDAIQMISDWLPQTVTCLEAAVSREQKLLWQVAQHTNALRGRIAASGSVATKEQKAELKKQITFLRYTEKQAKDAKARHERAKRLQTIFNEFTKN